MTLGPFTQIVQLFAPSLKQQADAGALPAVTDSASSRQCPAVRSASELRIPLGTVLGNPCATVDLDMAKVIHAVVAGQTGMGKTVLLLHILDHIIFQILVERRPIGLLVIEPHHQLIEGCLARIAKHLPADQKDALLPHVHHLEIGNFDQLFALDLLRFHPDPQLPPHRWPSRFAAFVDRMADILAQMLVRKFALPLNVTPSLSRIIKHLVMIAAYARNPKGEHFPLEHLDCLVDVYDPLGDTVTEAILPLLPRSLQAFLLRLRANIKGQDQTLADGTLNRLQGVMNAVGRMLFSRSDERSFHLPSVLPEPGIILVDAGETGDCSEETGDAIGGMLLSLLFATIKAFEPGTIPHWLCFMDEASHYIAEDVDRNLQALRKWMSVWISTQDVSSLRRGDVDLSSKVLSQTNCIMTFNQSAEHDLQILVPRICRGNLSFEERTRKQEFSDGFDLIPYKKHSTTTADGVTRDSGDAQVTGQNLQYPVLPDGRLRQGENKSLTISARSGSSHAESQTISQELLVLPRHRIEQTPDGLRTELDVQKEKLNVVVSCLDRAQLVAKLPGQKRAVAIQVVHVDQPFETPAYHQAMVGRLKDWLRSAHNYYIIEPDLTPKARDERLLEWLASLASAVKDVASADDNGEITGDPLHKRNGRRKARFSLNDSVPRKRGPNGNRNPDDGSIIDI